MAKWTLKAAARVLGRDVSARVTLSAAQIQAIKRAAIEEYKARQLHELEYGGMAADLELPEPLDMDALDAEYATELDGFSAAMDSELAAIQDCDAQRVSLASIQAAIKRESLRYGVVVPEALASRLGRRLSPAELDELRLAICTELDGLGYEHDGSRWFVDDEGAVFDELRGMGDIAPDADPAWRYKAGHALYWRAFKTKGPGAATRHYGQYADPPGASKQAHRQQRGPTVRTLKRIEAAAGAAC